MDTIVDLMGKLSSAPVVVLAQILLFYVFHLAMSQILYKPLLQARRERRAVTTDKVAQAQALNEATLKLKEEYEERMRQARREALSQVSSAQREAAAARQEQLDRAKAQAEAIREELKGELDARQADEVKTGKFTVRWKRVFGQRLDAKALKQANPEIYQDFLLPTFTRRFSIA